MSEKIAKECCGSCEYYGMEEPENDEGYFECNKTDGNLFVSPLDDCFYNASEYDPRNPIENKYQKMWEELKLSIEDTLHYAQDKSLIFHLGTIKLDMKELEDIYK